MPNPSKESEALADLFKEFVKLFPQDENHSLERIIYDGVQKAAAEAPGVSYEDVIIAGRPCIWIRPAEASREHVILFMHGGGYSFGSPHGHRKLAAHLAKSCNCISLSVDYRLAPENKYPAALDDCVGAYKHLLEQGFEPRHIVVAGDSCGGGLATSVPLAAIQRGLPKPGASICLSPWYDLTGSSESRSINEENDVLNTNAFVAMLADRYVSGSGFSLEDPLVSPFFANLEDLPPHWISVGGYDMLRDDGVRLAEKANQVGVEVVLEVHDKQQHVCEFMAGKAPEADSSLQRIGEWVRKKISS